MEDMREDYCGIGLQNDCLPNRIMAKAMGFLLESREGVFVMVDGRRFIVMSDGEQIKVLPGDEHEDVPDGQLLWLSTKEEVN